MAIQIFLGSNIPLLWWSVVVFPCLSATTAATLGRCFTLLVVCGACGSKTVIAPYPMQNKLTIEPPCRGGGGGGLLSSGHQLPPPPKTGCWPVAPWGGGEWALEGGFREGRFGVVDRGWGGTGSPYLPLPSL